MHLFKTIHNSITGILLSDNYCTDIRTARICVCFNVELRSANFY